MTDQELMENLLSDAPITLQEALLPVVVKWAKENDERVYDEIGAKWCPSCEAFVWINTQAIAAVTDRDPMYCHAGESTDYCEDCDEELA